MTVKESPHDELIKRILTDPVHARGYFQSLLPKPIVDALDWQTLRLQPGTFVDETLRSSFSDLLFRVHVLNSVSEPRIYMLFEHKSNPDRWTMLQLLGYMVEIWRQHLVENPKAKYLPLVLPLVLHHGEHQWVLGREFSDLFDLQVWDGASDFVPKFSVAIDDLAGVDDEVLRARAISEVVRLTLWFMKRARNGEELLQRLPLWKAQLETVLSQPTGIQTLVTLLRYLAGVSELEPERLRDKVAALLGSKGKEVFMTTADILRAEGEAKGKLDGKTEGKAEGKAESILAILAARNLRPSDAEAGKISECKDLACLNSWLIAALHVEAVQELWTPTNLKEPMTQPKSGTSKAKSTKNGRARKN